MDQQRGLDKSRPSVMVLAFEVRVSPYEPAKSGLAAR